MEAKRLTPFILVRRDAITGNWTVAPSPDPTSDTPSDTPLPEPTSSPPPVAHHGPYSSQFAPVGGIPAANTDIPIAAVLLGLFVVSAAAHLTILLLNRRAGIKFLFSGMMFVLCFLRSVALSMRIVWASHPHVSSIAMAAGILTQTGSVLIFIVNLLIAQRIVRAYHAVVGWHAATTLAFRFLIACLVASLIMAITVTIQSFFTLDHRTRRADHIVQLFAGTYMAFLAFLPIPIIAIAALVPHSYHVEKFGAGRWRSKVRLVLAAAALATVGAVFRIYAGFATRPVDRPAWYHSRVCYYCFNFVIDLVIAAAYLLTRFDRRFIVPNGSKGPGDYGKGRRARRSSTESSNNSAVAVQEKDGEKNTGDDKHGDGDGKDGNGDGNGDGSEKPPLSSSDSKGKGKVKCIDIESDDKPTVSRSVPRLTLGSDIPTYGPGGEWNGVPWPFRTSWAMSRNFGNFGGGARPSSGNLNPPGTGDGDGDGDGDGAESSTSNAANNDNRNKNNNKNKNKNSNNKNNDNDDDNQTAPKDAPGTSGIDEGEESIEGSTKWGGETNSSTYIQEPEAALAAAAAAKKTRRTSFQPHQLQVPQRHEWGQAITSDEEIHLSPPRLTSDTVIWPFTSETQASGRDPVANNPVRHNSHASSSRTPPSHGRGGSPSRSRSMRNLRPNIEGGWI